MAFGPTGIYIHTNSDPASIPAATASQELSLRNRIVTPFANTTARDSAFSGLSSSAKEGILCWIVNRGGHCYWDATSNGWEWLGVNRVLYTGTRSSDADTSGGGGLGTSIILMPTITLPPGNRLIYVEATSIAVNRSSTLAGSPRLFVSASLRDERFIAAGTTQTCLAINRRVVASGSVDFDLRGLNNGPGAMGFGGSSLTVTDLGPTDS